MLMQPKKLYDYQQSAIDSVVEYWAGGGGSALVEIPTGGGKSYVMAELMRNLHLGFGGTRIILLTHVQELVEQDAQEIQEVWPDAPIGIYSAGLGRRDGGAPIVFASVQSVHKNVDAVGERDVVLIDEAHLLSRRDDGQYQQVLKQLATKNAHMRLAGFTATPYRTDSGLLTEGWRNTPPLFDEIVYRIDPLTLINRGILCPLLPYAPHTRLDVTGVRKQGGEYVAKELQAAVDKADISRAAIEETCEAGADRDGWMVFASGVEHAQHLRDMLREKGIDCEMVLGDTPKAERKDIIERFKARQLRCVVGNNVLCLDDKTEILTREGWAKIDEMTYEHRLACWDLDGSVVFCEPLEIIRRPRLVDEDMISCSSRYINFRVTPNHRMLAAHQAAEFNVVPAENLVGKDRDYPVAGVSAPDIANVEKDTVSERVRASRIRGLSFLQRRRGQDAAVAKESATAEVDRRIGLVPLNPHELTLDHCRFIGFWLGDGSLSGGRCVFSQSTAYEEIIDWFDRVLLAVGFCNFREKRIHRGEKAGKPYVRWSIARGTGSSTQARDSGYYLVEPYLNKYGTDLFWAMTREQILAVLEGFKQADGLHKSGRNVICGTQYKLYSLLQAVCACRGVAIKLQFLGQPRHPHHRPQWRMTWKETLRRATTDTRPVRETVWIPERVWCVTSKTGFIVTRRNGAVVVMGNTTGFNARHVSLLSILRPTASKGLHCQIMGRGLRTFPGKTDCLVLDFAGNTMRHGHLDMIDGSKADGAPGAAPAKECKSCGMINHASAKTCKGCGAEFPIVEQVKFAAHSSGAAIFSTQDEPVWYDVDSIIARPHTNKEGVRSIRLDYVCGVRTISHWISLESEKAGGMARRWWERNSYSGVSPRTVDDGLAAIDDLRIPGRIMTMKDGKYTRILNWDYSVPPGKVITIQKLVRPAHQFQRVSFNVGDF